MKKISCLILILSGMFMARVSAQNPIPSYGVPVDHIANFQEQQKSNKPNYPNKAKGSIIIKSNGSLSSIAIVYVYSLDHQDILGPFTMHGGDIISVAIDSREWGVLVESDDHITVDVWIE